MMDSFIDRLRKIRESAARFYVVDLHMHSPGSQDWDNSGNEEQSRDPNIDRIPPGNEIPDIAVESYRHYIAESGRELGAVTDHNVSSFGLAVAAKNDTSGAHILPGIELSVEFSDAPLIRDLCIHVLAIFDEFTHQEAFARILPPGTPSEVDRQLKDTFRYSSVDELIDCIHNEGGLAIAAHIESKNGLRGVYKNTTELMLEPIGGSQEGQEYLKKLGDQVKDELVKFDAIQVKPTTDAIHYKGPDGNLRVPLIVASDLHNIQELKVTNFNKFSFIKMAKKSFKSLSDALKFSDLRVRFATSLPQVKPPKLLGIKVVGRKATEKTFFDDTVLGFSDNLTCIIGPRGSGKSAVIDALRYIMGYNRTLSQISKVSEQIIDRQKHTLDNTRIEVLYQAEDEKIYNFVATYDPQENYVTKVYDIEGNRIGIDDVQACQEFPLNLFGWGELELLAEYPDTQREMLDCFIPNMDNLKETKEELYSKLTENREECMELAREMDVYFTNPDFDFQRLNEFKTRFDELNTEEIRSIFEKLDIIKAKQSILQEIIEKLQERLDKGDIAPELNIKNLLDDENIKEWAEDLSARLKPDELDEWMQKTSGEHQRKIQSALKIVQTESERLAKEEEQNETEIKKVIGEEQAITGDLRNKAKERYEKANANYIEYKKLYENMKSLLAQREKILDDIDEQNLKIFDTRQNEILHIKDVIRLVEDEHYLVDLYLNKQKDRDKFLNFLKEGHLKFSGQWKAGKRPEILSINLTQRALAGIIIYGKVSALENLTAIIEDKEFTFRDIDAESLVNDNTPFTKIEELDVYRINLEKLEKILKLQEIPIEDLFYITLSGKPIQYCSPGQKCSAMLPVVALTSQAPLVIDQPEDNLDNRLVSKALFKILAQLKETRQIIFATHNPNILVSGDAEQVLLLDADGNLEHYGCIDDPEIIDSVIGLMEGGADAFKRRQKKYEHYL